MKKSQKLRINAAPMITDEQADFGKEISRKGGIKSEDPIPSKHKESWTDLPLTNPQGTPLPRRSRGPVFAQAVQPFPAQMQHGPGDEKGADRGGAQQEQGDQQFVQAETVSAVAEMQGGGDEDSADAEGGGFGRPVQAHEKVGQTGQADGADQGKGRADEQEKGDEYFQHGLLLTR